MLSLSTYYIAERHLNRKMKNADLEKSVWINSTNNDTVEYWDNPSSVKPPMVLVHGFGASTKYQFFNQVKMLSKDYRLILPNLYYFGSTRPGSEKYTIKDQVDLVNSLIDSLQLDTFTLMGVSYGGLISIELALRKEQKIEKLILFDTPVKFMGASDIDSVKNYFDVPSIEELFVPSEPKGIKKLLYLATGKKHLVPTILFEEFHKAAYAQTIEEKRSLLSSMIGQMEDFQQRNYQLDMPILLLWGENDMAVPASKGRLLQNHLGDQCRYYEIDGAAHMPNMTKSREFNRIVSEFLNE